MQTIKTDLSPSNKVTRYFRVGRIIAHTLLGLMIASIVLPVSTATFKSRLIQWWCKNLLAAFNLKVSSQGHVPAPNAKLSSTMFVANHISWSDIHAINSIIALRFIAKTEIKNWPIFGYLVSRANALFIDRRNKRDAKRTIDVAVQSLQAGDNLCLFPEGTTSDGTVLHPFKSSLIQAAIEAKACIWPLAIRYPNENGGVNTDIAYAGETTLIESMQ
ncbi:MAG TPA: lysophospholipid acyltransferase family protein, partial [Methylotenera sp.]|nr:lysophospholipid acyltransferase family protein [Methylotenera sp.]